MARTSLTYDQLAATTLDYITPSITPQIYDSHILLDRMKKGKRVKICTGGNKVFHPIRDIELGEAGFISPNDGRTASHKDTRTALVLNWKYQVCDIVMMWDEKIQNRGKAQIISLVKDKVIEGMEDVHSVFNTKLYQLASSKAADDIDGLTQIVQEATGGEYAGIDADNSSNWEYGFYDAANVMSLYGSDGLDYGIRSCWFRSKPDLMVTTRAVASLYAAKLQPSERRVPMDGKSGATDLAFNGVPIVADPGCVAGDMFVLTTDHLWLYVQAGENFNTGKWEQDPTGYKRDRALISFVGNLVCDFRRGFGKWNAVT